MSTTMIRSKRKRGSYLVLTLPVVLTLFSLLLLLMHMERLTIEAHRLQAMADSLLASALSLRAETLETVAQNWTAVQAMLIGGTPNEAAIDSTLKPLLLKKTQDIKKSLPGYKGRIKSVITVVGEANGINKSQIKITNDSGLNLGIETKEGWIEDENHVRSKIADLWLARTWAPLELKGQPKELAEIELAETVQEGAGPFMPGVEETTILHRGAQGKLLWEVNLKDSFIEQYGNGGYPRTWADSLKNGKVQPFRLPFFDFGWESP